MAARRTRLHGTSCLPVYYTSEKRIEENQSLIAHRCFYDFYIFKVIVLFHYILKPNLRHKLPCCTVLAMSNQVAILLSGHIKGKRIQINLKNSRFSDSLGN